MTRMQRLYQLIRPLLFLLPAETAHQLGLAVLRAYGARSGNWRPPSLLRQKLLGVEFASPVGLAAGFDKDGRCLRGWRRLGFGFVEIGTVTPRPQAGHPRPRVIRLRSERSLQNWMGFNSRGIDFVSRQLTRRPQNLPLGVNIGKNAATPIDSAVRDYVACAAEIADKCDFLVINVSSPNTPGLRTLQRTEDLAGLIRSVVETAPSSPVLVKLSPDEPVDTLCALASASVDFGASGIVLSNTTVDYSSVKTGVTSQKGGLSGRVLADRARVLGARVGRTIHNRGVLVSVGGIERAEDVYWRLRHGAGLVEIYTGLVYQGPDLPRRLADELAGLLHGDGVGTIDEIIGADL